MMKKIVSYSLVLVAGIALLSGCARQRDSQQYLLTHPKYLKQQAQQCMRKSSAGQQLSPSCHRIMQAAQTFDQAVLAMSANPFQYGQKILHTEQQLAQAKQQLQTLQKQQPDDKASIKKTQQTIKELQDEIARMLAVVRVTGA